MKTFRTLLENAFQKVYRPLVIPLIIFLFVGVLSAFYFLHLTERENLTLKMKDYSRQLNDVFLDIELKYNTLIRDLYNREYMVHEQSDDFSQAFSNEFIAELKQVIQQVKFETLQIDEINYYRISEDGVVFETDFPMDMGLDLSKNENFWKPFEEASPGDIILKNLGTETLTGNIRLYSYLKLPDGSFFETGIRFVGMTDYIEEMGKQTFGSRFSDLTIFDEGDNVIKVGLEMTTEHLQHLNQSQTENKPVFQLNGLTNGTLYFVQQSRFGVYKYILNITYYNNLIIIVILLCLVFFLYLHRLRMKEYLKELSTSLVKPIQSLENKMKTFDLSSAEELREELESDVVEIRSMSKCFSDMCQKTRVSYEKIELMNEELEESFIENHLLIEKLEAFLEIPQILTAFKDMKDLLSFCYQKLLSIISETDCSLVAINEDAKLLFINGQGIDFQDINRLGLNAEKYLRKKLVLYKTFEKGEFMEEMDLQIEDPKVHQQIASIQQALIIPAVSKEYYYGHLAFYNLEGSGNKLTTDDYKIAEFFSSFLKAFLMIKEFSEIEMDIQKETIHAIIALLEKHDPYTRGHSENVAKLSMEFGRHLGFSEKKIQDLYWAGIVHDMGKILIPQNILNKPTRLTIEEFKEIKKHPVYAYDVFKNSRPMREIALFVKHHHEKYNGRGYPEGLKGKAIPYESRILCIADAWDAMTSERVYKTGLNKTEAISEIMQNKGEQFDPKLTEQWLKFISKKEK